MAARLAGTRGRVVLESARDDDGLGAWSFVAAEPSATLIARGHSLVELDAGGRPIRRFTADPLDAAEAFLAAHGCTLGDAEPGAPVPRVIGCFGYDLARAIEGGGAHSGARTPDRVHAAPHPSRGPTLGGDTPDLWLAAYDGVMRWRAPSQSGRQPPAGGSEPELVGPDPSRLARLTATARPLGLAPALGPLVADDDGAHHMARVERVRDYLAAGDVYQVNLARRLVARIAAPGDALALYAALAEVAPAPYGALIETDSATIISGSPERFLSAHRTFVETRPIKGTHPRAPGGAAALAASEKDAAEHLMIVDLERNDLGRIAEIGSVRVDELGYVVELPALYHKVSRVSAVPRAGTGYAQLLRATFPGGSITGAPKLRAMQIIDELEPARRGLYCGAFGYFGPTGCELALAIRIGVIAGTELRVHVGGGIVADSDPAAELAETEVKAAGWRAALAALTAARERR